MTPLAQRETAAAAGEEGGEEMTDVKELLERLDALRERAIAADEQLEAYREKGDPRPDMDEEYAPVAVFEYHASLDGHYLRLRAALLEMREENRLLREVADAAADDLRIGDGNIGTRLARAVSALAKGGGR